MHFWNYKILGNNSLFWYVFIFLTVYRQVELAILARKDKEISWAIVWSHWSEGSEVTCNGEKDFSLDCKIGHKGVHWNSSSEPIFGILIAELSLCGCWNLGVLLTLFQPEGADYAHHITASTPGFKNLTTSLDRESDSLISHKNVATNVFLCQKVFCQEGKSNNCLASVSQFFLSRIGSTNLFVLWNCLFVKVNVVTSDHFRLC